MRVQKMSPKPPLRAIQVAPMLELRVAHQRYHLFVSNKFARLPEGRRPEIDHVYASSCILRIWMAACLTRKQRFWNPPVELAKRCSVEAGRRRTVSCGSPPWHASFAPGHQATDIVRKLWLAVTFCVLSGVLPYYCPFGRRS